MNLTDWIDLWGRSPLMFLLWEYEEHNPYTPPTNTHKINNISRLLRDAPKRPP